MPFGSKPQTGSDKAGYLLTVRPVLGKFPEKVFVAKIIERPSSDNPLGQLPLGQEFFSDTPEGAKEMALEAIDWVEKEIATEECGIFSYLHGEILKTKLN